MIIKIQKVFRGYLARKRVAQIRNTLGGPHYGMSIGDSVKLAPEDIEVDDT